MAAIVLWGVWAFGSELMLNLRLNHEVQTLRQGNAQLAASNEQTKTQLATGGSPAAMEEAARKAGYTRQGEQVYVIVKPSDSALPATVGASPVPGVAPSPAVRVPVAKHDGGVIGAIKEWWTNLWH